MNSTPVSPTRRQSREIINAVIENSVFGPVQCLPHGDVLELRVLLRDAYPFEKRKGWAYRVWSEEVRFALGYPIRKPKRYAKTTKHLPQRVIPAMRGWAEERGMLLEPEASTEAETPTLDFTLQ